MPECRTTAYSTFERWGSLNALSEWVRLVSAWIQARIGDALFPLPVSYMSKPAGSLSFHSVSQPTWVVGCSQMDREPGGTGKVSAVMQLEGYKLLSVRVVKAAIFIDYEASI
jgi:hypothetical protein